MTNAGKVKERINEIEDKLKLLEEEKKALEKELKILLSKKDDSVFIGIKANHFTPKTPEEKIQLFTKLFRCREDVFPKFWENQKTGKSGYSPVCNNEWQKPICGKPQIKCTNCQNKDFIKLDSEVIESHLKGYFTIGTYAIRKDDRCIFLATDFDNYTWFNDAIAYKNAGRELNIDIAIERSRSGNGAHAWIFFIEPVPAAKARQLGDIILTKASSLQTTITLDSYDRFFPNQDLLPNGGFGNLIALPLQKKARMNGNSVFIDEFGDPYVDQWEFLANVYCLSMLELNEIISNIITDLPPEIPSYSNESMISESEKILKQDLYKTEIVGGELDIQVSGQNFIRNENVPIRIIRELKKIATFANPKFFELQKLRFSTWNTPKYIFCGDIDQLGIYLPRGLLSEIMNLLEDYSIKVNVIDNRKAGEKLELKFKGGLEKFQNNAVEEILKYDFGVLVSPTGTGKTVMACNIISVRKTKTLILVHRSELINQWIEKICLFIDGISKKEIGVLGGGRKKLKRNIDIAMIQSLTNREDLFELVKDYEQIIIDECHHIPAVSFEEVLKVIPSKFVLGLTATPYK